MNYAIIRTEKLTTVGNISSSSAHNFREKKTDNADPARTGLNRTTGAQSTAELKLAVTARHESTGRHIRKNAVLAVEYFIGASPEWFAAQSKANREAYFDKAEEWLRNKHGSDNVVAVTRQYDEKTPHICAYVVPIDPNGKLNASYFLDGPVKMSALQTDFTEQVGAQFGLQRGIEGSGISHKRVQQFYAHIDAPTPKPDTKIPEVDEPTFIEKVQEKAGRDTKHSLAIKARQLAIDRLQMERVKRQMVLEDKARAYDAVKPVNDARAARLAELRATAVVAREMPLEAVLEQLGCTRDPKDKAKNWRTPVGRLTVTGSKFFAHDQAKGGGGAIDLVMLLEQVDYPRAVHWLARSFGVGPVLSETVAKSKAVIELAAKSPPPPYVPPAPSPEKWPRVRDYLTVARRLSGQVVDGLHQLGRVYADRFANAVFVLGDNKGVELRGTGEQPFHGVRGEKAPFIIPSTSDRVKKAAFVESAIDAMSLRDLGFEGSVVSLAGNSPAAAANEAAYLRNAGWTVIAAFDQDESGAAMVKHLGEPIERLCPVGKDWNDDLRRGLRLTTPKPVAEGPLDALERTQQAITPGRQLPRPGYR